MKHSFVPTIRSLAPAIVVLGLSVATSPVQAQTPVMETRLTPPGAPKDFVMKTIDQAEPRTPINARTTPGDSTCIYSITKPGSYYLTTNIVGVANKHGISISCSNVTVDLNGFAVRGGVTNSHTGILDYSGNSALCVRNGSVQGWFRGVWLSQSAVVEKVCALESRTTGINVSYGSIVRDCVCEGNQIGIVADAGSLVSKCVVRDNQYGIVLAGAGSRVERCQADFNTHGIYLSHQCRGVVTDNTVSGNQCGINVVAADSVSVVVKNFAMGNATNYHIQAGHIVGNIEKAKTSGLINGNSGGSIGASASPWANFSD